MLLVKRYVTPVVIAVALYSLIYLIFGGGYRFMGLGIVFAILSSYLIRLCDDIGDYAKDLKNGKAIFAIKTLKLLCLSVVSVFCALALIFTKYPMLLAPLPILLQFLIGEK